MNINDVKVGMSVIFSYLGDEDTGVVTRIDGHKVWANWRSGQEQFVSASSIEPEHIPTQQLSLANTKIDVQKYADTYGLTLEQAHQEVQNWLFEQGCHWLADVTKVDLDWQYLYIGSFCKDQITGTHGTTEGQDYFKSCTNKEITLLRNVSVSVSLSIAPPEPSVELDGKQYTKAQLLKALAELEGK